MEHEKFWLLISTNNGHIVHKRYQLVPHPGTQMRGNMEPQDSASSCKKWNKWAHSAVLRW
uniref:Uncharacterized protein n=1 Tax=Aegilops tauschii subsp. strangulata TaxID=200361 RepID=A0A453C2U0_AEGTS